MLDLEIARGFVTRGLYRKRLGYFVDGLAIGAETFIPPLSRRPLIWESQIRARDNRSLAFGMNNALKICV